MRLGWACSPFRGSRWRWLQGMPPVVAVLLASITAVFGGVTRDVLCNESPRFIATTSPTLCTLIGGVVFLG